MTMGALGRESVLDLAEIGAEMGDRVGGKAANLGELISAGVRVPPGFCVTTEAYDDVCRELDAHHDGLMERLVADATVDDGERLRSLLAAAEIPEDIAEAIAHAYDRLGADTPVAVRSSATAEDLPHASFAGQQDTYLNVLGHEAVLDAVRHCWGSLWTDRAIAYRAANGIDHRSVRLAVVVQRMVDAPASGVLFTANPLTGCLREAVVDANYGLGESVVSGTVNPDHFVVNTETGSVVSRHLGDKSVSVRAKPGGGTETVALAGDDRTALSDEQVLTLARLGEEVERHYGAPQDIEWCLDTGGEPVLTQSRPITTLFPLPEEQLEGLRVYLSLNTVQGVPQPLTPMGAAVLQRGVEGLVRGVAVPKPAARSLRNANGWLFFDITGAMQIGRVHV